MQKVNLSSAECAAQNAANAEAISLGLVDEVQPSEHVIAREKEEADRKLRDEQKAAEMASLVQQFSAQFGSKVSNVKSNSSSIGFDIGDVRVCAQSEVVSRWSSERVWKITFIVSNAKDQWMEWGATLAPDAGKLAKATAKIAAMQELHDGIVLRAKVGQDGDATWVAFFKDPANKDICVGLGLSEYRQNYYRDQWTRKSYPGTPNSVEGDQLRVKGVTRTLAQWRQVIALNAKHAAEREALLASFNPAPAA